MKLAIATFKPASPRNFTKGRTAPIDRITIHHSVGMEASLAPLWQNPARGASSHFFVHPDYIEQYVDTDDMAWTNSSPYSNNRAITIEVRGDWRTYYDQKTLDQLTKLLTELRKNYPSTALTYHCDEKAKYGTGSTECPAKLKTAGYAQQCWDKAKPSAQPAPAPKPPVGSKMPALNSAVSFSIKRSIMQTGTPRVIGSIPAGAAYYMRGVDPVYPYRMLIKSKRYGNGAVALYYTNGQRIPGWK